MGPQDQYQYLYEALLSLVNTNENPYRLAMNINGTMASMCDQAESTESLVWERPSGGLEQSWEELGGGVGGFQTACEVPAPKKQALNFVKELSWTFWGLFCQTLG